MVSPHLEIWPVQSTSPEAWRRGVGDIREVNQVAAYFAYANRTVLGLGVTTAGEVLGLSPSDYLNDDQNWQHH